MEYVSVAKMAEKWGLSERSVRNYCAHGRISNAKLIGKTWYIPEDAQKPDRINKKKDTPTLPSMWLSNASIPSRTEMAVLVA